MKAYKTLFVLASIFLICSCQNSKNETLPILGKKKIVDGVEVDHKIPDWTYLNQDSMEVTNKDLSDVVYVSDFFFIKFNLLLKVFQLFKTERELNYGRSW